MKQFGKILKFELKYYLTNKVFVGVTVLLMALLAVVMFFPRFSGLFSGSGDDERDMMLISCAEEKYEDMVLQSFSVGFPEYRVVLYHGGEDAMRAQIREGEAECAFILDSLTQMRYCVDNLSIFDQNSTVATELLREIYRFDAMISGGMSPEDTTAVLGTAVSCKTVTMGKNQTQNYFYTYFMIMALYMVIILYGQLVATNVAAEKNSRAMELLVTSAKPVSMMFGKVISSCLAGLIQLVAVFGTACVCFELNRTHWDADGIVAMMFGIPASLLGYMLLYFVLGYFIYGFLFGAIGSLASKTEDINTTSMPVNLLFMAGFMVVIVAMNSGTVDGTLMRVCSIFPFTSPMAMFTRIAMSTVSAWEIGLSVVVLIGSAVAIGIIAAKIYRVGVLMYGTPPKMRAILKTLRKA